MGKGEYNGEMSSSIVGERGDQMILEVLFFFKLDFESAVSPEYSENSHSAGLCDLAMRLARREILMYHLYNIHYQIL